MEELSYRDDLWYMEVFSIFCAEFGIPLDLGWCSQGISAVA